MSRLYNFPGKDTLTTGDTGGGAPVPSSLRAQGDTDGARTR